MGLCIFPWYQSCVHLAYYFPHNFSKNDSSIEHFSSSCTWMTIKIVEVELNYIWTLTMFVQYHIYHYSLYYVHGITDFFDNMIWSTLVPTYTVIHYMTYARYMFESTVSWFPIEYYWLKKDYYLLPNTYRDRRTKFEILLG